MAFIRVCGIAVSCTIAYESLVVDAIVLIAYILYAEVYTEINYVVDVSAYVEVVVSNVARGLSAESVIAGITKSKHVFRTYFGWNKHIPVQVVRLAECLSRPVTFRILVSDVLVVFVQCRVEASVAYVAPCSFLE